MSQRRMFSKKITDTDMFMDLPAEAQILYFQFNMHADDDGFIGNPRTILRMVGASMDSYKLLAAKNFIIVFEDGVTVITDWRIHNSIRKDRYSETIYQDHKKELLTAKDLSYQRLSGNGNQVATTRQPVGNQMDTQVRLGKDRLGKDRKTYSPADAAPPLPYQEIVDYLNQKAGTKYRSTTKKTQTLIKARFNEKFALDDFKQVIDNKVSEWKSDNNMAKYLRPETLFGTKFESYLNQSKASSPQNYGGGQVADNLPW